MKRSPCGIVQRPAVGPERRAAVDVDLRARAARAGVAHLPEVVLVAEPLDALQRHADLFVPDLLGLVVALVNRDPEPVAVEAPAAVGRVDVTSSQLHGMISRLK